MTLEHEQYARDQEAWLQSIGGLEPGDRVKIIARPPDKWSRHATGGWRYAAGWTLRFENPVGLTLTVRQVSLGAHGIELWTGVQVSGDGDSPGPSTWDWFPFYVLVKIEED